MENPSVALFSDDEMRRYRCPGAAVEMVESIKTFGTYSELLHQQDSSFSEWRMVRTIERDGRLYQRMSKVRQRWMLDIEIKVDGYIGDLVPVSAEEAFNEQLKR